MFKTETHDAFKAYALTEFPKEACGFIIERNGVEEFVPMENINETPDRLFEIRGTDYVALYQQEGVVIKSLLHTHVPIDGVKPINQPSKLDVEKQIQLNIPFGFSMCEGENVTEPIYFGTGVPKQPLIGRQFMSVVQDCLALLRDYYADHNVIIPMQAYDREWFKEEGQDLYATNFTRLGFEVIPDGTERVGDTCLMKLGAKVANHAAVMCAPDLLLHHLDHHLSMREPVYIWRDHICLWVRHKDFVA